MPGFAGRAASLVATLLALLALGPGNAGASVLSAPPGAGSVLVTVAGNGTTGPPKAGPAAASPLTAPADVVVDAAGDAFVSDPGASEVLKVSATTGALSVVAGTGTSGQPGQGPAAQQELQAPTGLAVDAAGDLFIADPGASEVLRVSAATGALSVVAGTGSAGMPEVGPATVVPLEAPTGVAVDAAGDIFIADPGASEVLEVSGASGVLSVVAGTGTAGMPTAGPATSSPLEAPSGLWVYGGTLLVADPGANEILEISLATHNLSVAVGTGRAGTPEPGPAKESPLDQPTDVAVDAQGDLWVADRGSSQVLEISAGQLSVVAGTAQPGRPRPGPAASSPLEAPTGISVDGSGNVWVADAGASEVEEIAYPPAVTGVLPAAGPTGGGTTVTVSGRHFGDAVAIDFGGRPAERFSCQHDGSCTAVAPRFSPGAVDVSVTTPWGQSRLSAADQFYYYSGVPSAPSISVTGRTGPGAVAVSGTTTPGARVGLWHSPYRSTTFAQQRLGRANARGTYRFIVGVGRATRFFTVVDGHRSAIVTAQVRDLVAVVLTAEKGAVSAKVVTDPPVSGVEVTFYQVGHNGGLLVLGRGRISSRSGVLTKTFSSSGQTVTIEAQVDGGDGGLGGNSPPQTVTLAGH